MNNLLENLNKEQLEAVTHGEGPLLIVAGAGTGKTTAITQRIAYLIEQGHAKSDEILALTFTEKAAGEMEERVDRLLPIGYLDLWISTFHSFGERILKEHGLSIGLPTGFKLLNEFEQWALVKKNLDKFDLNYYRPLGNPTKFIHALIKHFSRAKDEDISPREYLEYAGELQENFDAKLSGKKGGKRGNFQFSISNFQTDNKEIAEQEVARISEVANAYHIYQQLLLDNNSLDFGDLINYCLKLFRERPAILEQYRKKFKFILLDEFQDTNWSQYELIKILSKPKNLPTGQTGNLVVVGDDDQSIFRFRGASMSNILQFVKDFPKAKKIALVKNYRNKQNILDLSYEFIKKNNPNRLEYQLNNSQKPGRGKTSSPRRIKMDLNKKLIAQARGEGETEVIQGVDLDDEVGLVVNKIVELKNKNKEVSWNDFAILVRANESAKDFCNTLENRNIPYQFLASRGLYAKPVIMDVVSYFKLLDDYHESGAVFRILNLPMFNFSHQDLANFNYWARRKTWSLYEVLRNAPALQFNQEIQDKINKVLSLIEKHSALAREKSASEVLIAFMNESGYLKYLSDLNEQKSREAMSLLNQFLKRIKTFEAASDDRSAKAFLLELTVEIEAGEEGSLAPDIEAGPEAVKILTVHGAKGLEFKYVFVVNLVDKRFPTIERREQIELPDALIKEILPVGDIHTEEERRLFYVAMTRAKEGLYFSWAEDYGGARKKKPSRFLEEIGMVKEKKTKGKEGQINLLDQKRAEADAVKERKIAGSAPNYFSYTQLAAFSNCPYQYRFAHILRIPVRGKDIFSFGKTMHSTLQKVFLLINEKRGSSQANLFGETEAAPSKKVKISLDEILKLYEESWIDEWYESKKIKEERRRQGREILQVFYEKHKNDWPLAIFLEKGFSFKLSDNGEPFTIRGVIDRIDQADGRSTKGKNKVKIVDYKTGQPKKKLSFEEKEQLLIYQLAIQDLFKQEIDSLSFYYLDNNSEVEFLGSAEELEKVKQKITKTVSEIKRGEFPPKPSKLCGYCDFKDICEFRKI